MKMLFQQHNLPRTMTRKEWIKTYRWVRQTRKELESNEQKMLAAALICGNDRIKDDILNQIITPPLLVIPESTRFEAQSLLPGYITYVK